MTTARASQVNLDVTPFYHCMARCVRRAFLCGEDHASGRNCDHRKTWVVERLSVLAQVFAIDICAYAVMSNHLHLVLHVDRQRALTWNTKEIKQRLKVIFPRAAAQLPADDDERGEAADATASSGGVPSARAWRSLEVWRDRLSDLSWFMRCLNEFIARQANQEDFCTGRFWEGRFKSQALLDEGALLSCMSYVDLNPVRAGVASTLDGSDWTSIQQRLQQAALASRLPAGAPHAPQQSGDSPASSPAFKPGVGATARVTTMVPLAAMSEPQTASFLPLQLTDYVELLEWTGAELRPGKRGCLQSVSPPTPLLKRCGLAPQTWLEALQIFNRFSVLVGSPQTLQRAAPAFQRKWAKGQAPARVIYSAAAE